MTSSDDGFAVDHMLYKLGRYLRCLGFDTTWDPDASTAELVRRANAEGRLFLTRSSRVAHREPVPARGRLLVAEDPVEQVRELVRTLGLDPEARLFTRCVRCNEPLEPLAPDAPRLDSLPARVRARYESFFTCPRCDTVFWKGSHVTNTCRKLGLPDAAEAPAADS